MSDGVINHGIHGNWSVISEQESFRIFPQNKKGQTVPITKINQHIHLRNANNGAFIMFKRFLHMKQWHWRDSRSARPVDELDVLNEISRLLFNGNRRQAEDLVLAVMMRKA